MVILGPRPDLLNQSGGRPSKLCVHFIEVKLIEHKINSFKVNNSVTFSELTVFAATSSL